MMRSAAEFVAGFRRYWSAPSLDGLGALLAPDAVLVQPLSPRMHGLDDVRRQFATIFAWLPDVTGEVDRWSGSGGQLFIELRLRATIGGRPFEWPLIDRFTLRSDGLASERVTYFDPTPLVLATIGRPRGWMRFVRSGAALAMLRG